MIQVTTYYSRNTAENYNLFYDLNLDLLRPKLAFSRNTYHGWNSALYSLNYGRKYGLN